MALDEFTTVQRARSFVSRVAPATIPVPMEPYLETAGSVLRREADLLDNEPGWSFAGNGKHYICVNGNDREERQRFTICHEIGHIVLGLSSDHKSEPWWSAKRPLGERLCDLFAAELLLPDSLFMPMAEDAAVSLESVDSLAGQFLASATATGFRFAAAISTPCAFVLSQEGQVRYAARSKALTEASAWVPPRMDLPNDTLSFCARAGDQVGRREIDADVWFSNWERGGKLLEEARHLAQWDQTLTLLWFEGGEVPSLRHARRDSRWATEGREYRETREDEEESGLKELDGNLRWPGKRRR